jgi:hypothetical protein
MVAWHIANPPLLTEVRQLVSSQLPTFRVEVEGETVVVRGRLEIVEEGTGQWVYSYDVEAELLPDHPESVPLVRELGKKIVKGEENHFNGTDERATACLFVEEERFERWPKGADIVKFINGPVHEFFFWQAHKALTGKELPSRPHRTAGRIQFYEERAKTTDAAQVLAFIELVSMTHLPRQATCHCGSREKLRRCRPEHAARVHDVRVVVPPRVAQDALENARPILRRRARAGPQVPAGDTSLTTPVLQPPGGLTSRLPVPSRAASGAPAPPAPPSPPA